MRGAIAETQTSLARGLMRFHLHTSRFIRSKRVAVASSMPQPFMSRADNCPAALYTHDWDLAALGAGERASRGILRPHGEQSKRGALQVRAGFSSDPRAPCGGLRITIAAAKYGRAADHPIRRSLNGSYGSVYARSEPTS